MLRVFFQAIFFNQLWESREQDKEKTSDKLEAGDKVFSQGLFSEDQYSLIESANQVYFGHSWEFDLPDREHFTSEH